MDDLVGAVIDRLVVGQTLAKPLYNESGVLLLAAGSKITDENIRQIKARGVHRVFLGREDARNLRDAPAGPVEEELSDDERIADLFKNAPPILNKGESLRDSLVHHGRAPFDPEFYEQARQSAKDCDRAIEGVMNSAAAGRDVDGEQLAKATTEQIETLVSDIECTLAAAFEAAGDSSLAEQSSKNALLGMSIGIELGLDVENTRTLGISGCLQNIGFANLPPEIRFPTRKLTLSETLELQKVPRRSVEMLERIGGIPPIVRSIVSQVYERPDGSGFPRGLKRDSIHLFARMLQISNTYAELTTPTPYRPALTPYSAMVCLLKLASLRKVEREIVRSMLRVTSLFPIGSFVALSDGSVAQVVRANHARITEPVVTVRKNAAGNSLDKDGEESLIDLAQCDLEIVKALPTPGKQESAASDLGESEET